MAQLMVPRLVLQPLSVVQSSWQTRYLREQGLSIGQETLQGRPLMEGGVQSAFFAVMEGQIRKHEHRQR